MVLVADYQTAGRGQGTNSWESERGQNLTCSLGFSPDGVKASRQYILSMAIAVALTETLAGLPHPVSIKWPNDIYVGDKKICGILIENMLKGEHIRHCIIGIGLNINQKRFVSDAPNPTSMALESGHDDFTASLVDVKDDGHLVLQDAQGQQRRYAFKEVTFVIEKT